MPFAFAVVCEAAADFRTATTLAERVIRERVDWVDEESFAHCPLWHGSDQARPYILWTEIGDLASAAGIRAHGHFGDQPGEHDAYSARRALLLFKKWKLAGRPLDGVLLLRDDDRDASRRIGLEQASKVNHGFGDRVVVGLARCVRESWALVGYDPADSGEAELLNEVRTELGYDPRSNSHELKAKHISDKRSAKRVLGILTRHDQDREARCWEHAPLDRLRERGRESGLADFLDEIRSRLLPLFRPAPK